MISKVVIPKMGMSTVEVDLKQCFVKVGDSVEVGTPIAEVESEKSVFTIESEAAGRVVKILIEPGTTTEVGAAICTLETE